MLVLGSGPIRIGQGIEFDYCSVHATWAFSRAGYETIIINNNPETVSTDYDTADRLYFEPLFPEDVMHIIEVEKHARFAYPLSTFILTLIGVSLSSRKVRGGTGLHIGIGTGLCFSYILFNRFFEEFAKSGTLPPGLAVWLPNIIYLGIAVYLYRKAPK